MEVGVKPAPVKTAYLLLTHNPKILPTPYPHPIFVGKHISPSLPASYEASYPHIPHIGIFLLPIFFLSTSPFFFLYLSKKGRCGVSG